MNVQEPKIPAVEMLGFVAAVLGDAEQRYRAGAAASTSLTEALGRYSPPDEIAEACRAAWAVMVEPDQQPRPPKRWVSKDPWHVARLDVSPLELAQGLREILGVTPTDTEAGAWAITVGRTLPEVISDVDVGALLGWTILGALIFSGEHPSLATLRAEVKRYGVVLAMTRARGNVAMARRLTKSSYDKLRTWLVDHDLHPWAQPRLWAQPPLTGDG